MKHTDGIHVQLRAGDDSWIEEYDDEQISTPARAQRDYTGVCVAEKPGIPFRVKIWFRDFVSHKSDGDASFSSHKNDGLAVIVGCGHGKHPPGAFDHVQYYWIKPNNLNTNHYRFCDYEVWKEDPHGPIKVDSIEYTMPAPPVVSPGTCTDGIGLPMAEGSVVVSGQRGKFVNKHGSLSSNNTLRNSVLPARAVTDPPDTRAYRASIPRKSQTLRHRHNDDPIVIARHWFEERDGEHGIPYVFEFKSNIDPVGAGLERSPDSGEQDQDPEDESDGSDSGCDTADTGSELDPTENPMFAGELMTAKRKRKVKLGMKSEMDANLRKKSACKIRPDTSIAVLISEDQDDEEIHPDRNNSVEPHVPIRAGGGRVSAFSAFSAQGMFARFKRFVAGIKIEDDIPGLAPRMPSSHEQRHQQQHATVKLKHEDIYQGTNRPSLYQGPDSEEASARTAEALEVLADHQEHLIDVPKSTIGGEREALISDLQQQAEPSEGHNDSVEGANEEEDEIQILATVRQQQSRTIIDLTMEDSDDDEGAEDEQAEIEAREAKVKIARAARAARIEAEAEKAALDARQARDKKRRDREKKDRAQEKQRQADAARDRRIRKG
ncbi:hypothetical protein LTR56_008784 [Elasticomyces elasticus]|nr:hypothetical protein LTR22_021968 [Elasticomyces elasticus]KAK3645906.1 hypothetical protein LTR56_008784 [Elasticomyces elasticus]KAK4928143.1 hypothetical protein LTR49_005081 [Elasticomyces elasticus]KAK5765895.1 hypothetical protein LTS12_003902 [Elasticomyces elasticus]